MSREHLIKGNFKHAYKVVPAKRPSKGGFVDTWNIVDNNIPLYEVNKWIGSRGSINTQRRYAYALVSFLKYLDKLGKRYGEVMNKAVVSGYIDNLLHGDEDNNILDLEPRKSYQTIKNNLSIVKSFYTWLKGEKPELTFPFDQFIDKNNNKGNNVRLRKSFLYGQIWSNNFSSEIRREFEFKEKRNYRKWYTKEEIEALSSNFKTIRDKVIFLISVEGGCRIDEILNIKYSDYDSNDCKIYVSKSKTFQRDVYLPPYLCKEIDRYINTERQEIEKKLGLLDFLFVNLNKGKHQGKRVSYLNYYRILKNCARRSGFIESEIITHAGRSTRAQQLIEYQIMHPEEGLTDELILEIMGWSSIDSIKPYKKQFNPTIMKETLKKVKERKRKTDGS